MFILYFLYDIHLLLKINNHIHQEYEIKIDFPYIYL